MSLANSESGFHSNVMTQEFSFIALFIFGLFSTLHCIGMCGGVVGALTFSLLPEVRENKRRLFVYVLAYNVGRITSYMVAGLIVGALGMTLMSLIGRHNAHLIARYLTAMMMILVGLYVAGWFPQMAKVDQLGSQLWKAIQPIGKRFMPVRSPVHAFGFGMVWGWLPCGLVYSALLLTALGGNAFDGALGMLAFGAGTLPALITTGLVAGGVSLWLQKPVIRNVFGALMIALGIATLLVPLSHDHPSISHPDHGKSSDGMKCGAGMMEQHGAGNAPISHD